mgnify:CR=1 FL=1
MRSIALALCASLATGCASSGPATATPDALDTGATVDMVVINRTVGPVTAFAQWRSGPRLPLGEVRANATRRFTTPLRGTEVWLSVDVLAAPSAGTTAGPTAMSGRSQPRPAPQSFVTIEPGDALEWVIHQTYPAVDLTYRRLGPP